MKHIGLVIFYLFMYFLFSKDGNILYVSGICLLEHPRTWCTSHKSHIYTSEVLVTVYVKLLLAHYYAPELCSMYHVIFLCMSRVTN